MRRARQALSDTFRLDSLPMLWLLSREHMVHRRLLREIHLQRTGELMKIWGQCADCDRPFASYRDFAVHAPCGPFANEELTVHSDRSYAQWGDNDAVMVHYDPK